MEGVQCRPLVCLSVCSHFTDETADDILTKFGIYTVFKYKFTLLLFAITKSDIDRFQ